MRRLIVFTTILALWMPSWLALNAHADGPRTDGIVVDNKTGKCITESSGSTVVDAPNVNSHDVVPPPRKCYAPSGGEIPCQTEDGYWSSVYHCYIKLYDGPDTEKLRAKL